MTETTGTFVVTHAEEASAVIRNVETAQVHTLGSNPGLAERDVLEATIAPEPPMEVTWQVLEVDDRRTVDVIDSDLAPTQHSLEVASDLPEGELTTIERAGTGEIHVVTVPPARIEDAATDIVEDLETVMRAARLDAVRVEVRRDADAGVLSVRYLPD